MCDVQLACMLNVLPCNINAHLTLESVFAVQNPVTTALWMVACCQIITPMFSFSIDCALFCNPRRRPDVLVEAVYVTVVSLGCMLGPAYMFQGHGSYFDLPFSYRYKAYAICVFGALMYAVGLQCTRLFLSRRCNRIVPVT